LIDYWQCRCPVTGIDQPSLLRASHIIPWADCADEERLNVYNGLLLSALWDAAFDAGLVTFDPQGVTLFSSLLTPAARAQMPTKQIFTIAEHQVRLEWHRTHVFQP
jgi:predicted restriction endonuclease